MRSTLGPLVAQLAVAAVGAAMIAWRPFAGPPSAVGLAAAGGAGAVVGAALFFVLARRAQPPPLTTAPVFRAVASAAPLLAVSALGEEALWRYLCLGGLRPVAGDIAALAASSAGFALAHAAGGGRAVAVHVVTGAVFGSAYLATGHLAAALAAHLSYNILVVAATTSWAQERPAHEAA